MARLLRVCQVVVLVSWVAASCAHAATPVVIDTDVGSVFDDSAAIAVALQSPALSIKLM